MSPVHWVRLDGTVNTRDLGGVPVDGGGEIRPRRLLRSDNLQDLSAADVDLLIKTVGVRTVIDLRAPVEVEGTGPSPLDGRREVTVHRLSLFPATDADERGGQAPVAPAAVLPWQDESGERQGASARTTYLRFLQERPDSALAALRLLATSDGATLIHCAAGKDRTGVIVALALAEVGVGTEAIVADYVATAERIEAILIRLRNSPVYASDVRLLDGDHHRPREKTMRGLLDDVDRTYGGVPSFLRSIGWTEDDGDRLRAALLAD